MRFFGLNVSKRSRRSSAAHHRCVSQTNELNLFLIKSIYSKVYMYVYAYTVLHNLCFVGCIRISIHIPYWVCIYYRASKTPTPLAHARERLIISYLSDRRAETAYPEGSSLWTAAAVNTRAPTAKQIAENQITRIRRPIIDRSCGWSSDMHEHSPALNPIGYEPDWTGCGCRGIQFK